MPQASIRPQTADDAVHAASGCPRRIYEARIVAAHPAAARPERVERRVGLRPGAVHGLGRCGAHAARRGRGRGRRGAAPLAGAAHGRRRGLHVGAPARREDRGAVLTGRGRGARRAIERATLRRAAGRPQGRPRAPRDAARALDADKETAHGVGTREDPPVHARSASCHERDAPALRCESPSDGVARGLPAARARVLRRARRAGRARRADRPRRGAREHAPRAHRGLGRRARRARAQDLRTQRRALRPVPASDVLRGPSKHPRRRSTRSTATRSRRSRRASNRRAAGRTRAGSCRRRTTSGSRKRSA